LKKDQQETVLEYFELCRKFWDDRENKLDAWTQAVQNGQIPQFGANLLY